MTLFYGPLHMDMPELAEQERTYNSSALTQDVV